MARGWCLEDYDAPDAEGSDDLPCTAEGATEEERLVAFDKGYKAGWDDATAAYETEQNRITAEFAHNLQSMSFTYYEARGAMLNEMEALLRGMVEVVLPSTLQASLGATILDRVELAAQDSSMVRVEIVIAPGNRERLERLLEARVSPPVSIREEASLGDGQAFLRLGSSEEKIDLVAVLDEMKASIAEFFIRSADPERKVTTDVG